MMLCMCSTCGTGNLEVAYKHAARASQELTLLMTQIYMKLLKLCNFGKQFYQS